MTGKSDYKIDSETDLKRKKSYGKNKGTAKAAKKYVEEENYYASHEE
jgi:hypothetical protein